MDHPQNIVEKRGLVALHQQRKGAHIPALETQHQHFVRHILSSASDHAKSSFGRQKTRPEGCG
jgi:hypothetical protein